MVGTASLPHVLMRYFTTPSVREARVSVAWSLLFIFILYFTAPAYAAFAKWTMLDLVASGLTPENIAEKAGWLIRWASADSALVQICGKAATDAAIILAACAEQGVTAIGFSNITLNGDMIVLATPEMAGMPYVISGLVAAGGLAAALSTADGLLLAIANALSHDIYYKMLDTNASTARRLTVSRILLVGVAVVAAYVASTRPSDILSMVAWAFSLAAAGIFPALVLGIWWKRTTTPAAIAGIIAGFGVCVYYLVATRYFAPSFFEMWGWLSGATEAQVARYAELKAAIAAAADPAAQTAAARAFDTFAQSIASWWGIKNLSAAAFGLPVGFVVMIVVSLMTKAPSKEMQDMIGEIRIPRGKTVMEEKAA
jgi:cation/acetate symporter